MPQMAPMNWLLLFLMFIVIFMMFNSLNYFCFIYNPKTSKIKQVLKSINWKW
uniref:ATP synthase complex subunit 8 n=1 Tax=Aloconota currax TaxID=877758 RepID=A0A0S2M6H3_9COLE|nr:ATP synthase F0 subunit 8 [Aloconota currax]ARH54856.1 ATP synthase F0 subunit 8 [Aloconota currax]